MWRGVKRKGEGHPPDPVLSWWDWTQCLLQGVAGKSHSHLPTGLAQREAGWHRPEPERVLRTCGPEEASRVCTSGQRLGEGVGGQGQPDLQGTGAPPGSLGLMLLCNAELDWSLSLVPGRQTISLESPRNRGVLPEPELVLMR